MINYPSRMFLFAMHLFSKPDICKASYIIIIVLVYFPTEITIAQLANEI